MFGETTDPMPYLVAAYAIGALLLGGYAVKIVLDRKRLKLYLAALTTSGSREKNPS